MALHLRADENGTRAWTAPPAPFEHGLAGTVRLLLVRQVEQGLLGVRFILIVIEHPQLVERDATVGDGAGLIKVQAVDARQRLHRFELLHQRVLARKAHGRNREVQ